MNKIEIFNKHHVLTDGLKRIYYMHVHDRRLDMLGTTPTRLIMFTTPDWGNSGSKGNGPSLYALYPDSWIGLLKELVTFLQANKPKTKEELLAFETDWNTVKLFRESKDITNMMELEDGLYFSYNYSGNHSSWIVSELLKYYGIEHGILYYHRTTFSEPKEVLDVIREERISLLKDSLINDNGLSEEKADKVISTIDQVLNKLLVKENIGYNDFFAFDDKTLFANTKSKILARLPYITHWSQKQIDTARKYLDYLTPLYRKLDQEARKHSDVFNTFPLEELGIKPWLEQF